MTHAARTYLFVPANRPDRYAKALSTEADEIIFDLEDAVPPEEKKTARDMLANWLTPKQRIIVRVNAVNTEWFEEDLRLLAHPGIAGVMLSKAERPDHVQSLRKKRRDIAILPLIETASGMANVNQVAASEGVQRLVFGSIDLQAELGMQCEDEELLTFRSMLTLASCLAGLIGPVDGVCTAIDDQDKLIAETLRARRLGFAAKLCIHPRQISHVSKAFSPTDAEIWWARRVIDANEKAGGAAVRLDGKMIDRPVVLRAQALLEQAAPRSKECFTGNA